MPLAPNSDTHAQRTIVTSISCHYSVYYCCCSDSITEAMRELEGIQDKRDTVLCSAMLLVYAHKKCKSLGVCLAVATQLTDSVH